MKVSRPGNLRFKFRVIIVALMSALCCIRVHARDDSTMKFLTEQSFDFVVDFVSKGFSQRPEMEKAEFIMNLVNSRVDTINSAWGLSIQTFPIDFWNTYKGGRLKDRAERLNSKEMYGRELADWSWAQRAGACEEHATLMQILLQAAGIKNVQIVRTGSPHAFPVVGMRSDADQDNPWSWGSNNVYVPDSWSGRLLRGPYQIWNDGYTFNGGKYYGGSKGLTNRQKMKLFIERGPDFTNKHCKEFRELADKMMLFPNDVRNQLSLNPPTGACDDASSSELPDDIAKYTTEEKIFPVRAGQWLSTGIQLKKDESFSITATGTVKAVYPDGFTREWGPGGYYFIGFMRHTLKAMIGDKLIEVGASYSGTAPVDGELKLAITSTYEKITAEDRVIQGSFKVTVTAVKPK